MDEIFLSASVPVEGRQYYEGSDPLLIHAAVRALATLTLGRRRIVWGGHPSITPMIWAVCESLGLQYAQCVTLYQSNFFQDIFPEENARFKNVIYTESMKDAAASLRVMRKSMLERELKAAIFIGGMEGIVSEHELFREMHNNAPCVFLTAPGGGARELGIKHEIAPTHLDSTNFTELLITALNIDPTEERKT